MTAGAMPDEAALARKAQVRRFARLPLAAKLAIAFLGLVAFVLIVNGAIDAWLSYTQAKRAALEVESEKARAAAERVGVFLDEIQTELGWTAGVEWGYAKLEQQRYDFIRLLRQAPAITALGFIDGKGREQLAVSRLEPDAVGSGRDFSADPRFVRAVADKTWFGPVEFRRGSEPYMTIALAHVGKTPGVTVADVNLKLVWDVVRAIHVGDKGFAYVVDDKGRLIAHPDLSLVLRDTDFSHLPQVAAALAGRGASEAEEARSLDGSGVLTAHAVEPKTHWTVFVEQPLAEALATAYRSLLRSLALLGLGLTLAAVSGVALARRMAAPIRLLQAGAEKLGAGDLAQRLDIRTGDEIEALAGGFNRMAERLQESYENLEGKVEARTNDLNEALNHQTATSEILRVIASSPGDAARALQFISETSARLFGAPSVSIQLAEGDAFVQEYRVGAAARRVGSAYPRANIRVGGRNLPGTVVGENRQVHIPDLDDLDPSMSDWPGLPHARAGGTRTMCGTPLRREDRAFGALIVYRDRQLPFTHEELLLQQVFADQAVIAIENARLLEEVQARTKDLQKALERQQASAEILRVIGASPTDVKPVFDAICFTAARLFGCDVTGVFLVEGARLTPLTGSFSDRLFEPHEMAPEMPLEAAHNFPAQAAVEKRTVYVPDYGAADTPAHERYISDRYGLKCGLYLPLLRKDECIGVFLLTTAKPDRFDAQDIALAESFRDQAQIAMENTRLFSETKESLQQQTATADVLKVISRSAFDLDAVFQTLVTSAVELCKASSGTLCVRDGEVFRYRGMAGPEASAELQNYLVEHPLSPPTRRTAAGRTILSRQAEQIEDVLSEPDYAVPFDANGSPARALLAIPMLGKTDVLGAIVVARAEPGGFPPRHVEILRTFADQAVIAIENARLFEEVQARTRELEQSLSDLRKTQDRLVQSEKLASLGQLTAGIAHEIKNPLNFVNNFASLSRELLEELHEVLERLPDDAKADADELISMVDSNLEKVVHHGKRADSIVKNMLLHSREGSGERARVNVNAMVEEALNLGYHGARAEKPGFNVTLDRDFDPQAGEADIYLQEVTRVLLNLISNGFYAGAQRKLIEPPDYAPTLKARTRDLGHSVEIRIRDNGTGIADEVRAKMFNPFFTTKPAGEGTGLGLSLSHDIVVKQHGGTLDVETEPGVFTEFVITLPRGGATA